MTTFRVPRRATAVKPDPDASDGTGAPLASKSRPLADHRDASAYVLLGGPGSGKTTAFQMECDADPDRAVQLDVRDFLALDLGSHTEWRGKTLFVDGLDEMRTGSGDWRSPLDSIRRRLEQLGHPRFRLSCRSVEWLGEDDAAALMRLDPYKDLVVLRLDPLREDEVRSLLEESCGKARADEFMNHAHEQGLHGFLQHPLHIELLLKAGVGGVRVRGRRDLFDAACRSMTREQSQAHRAAARGMPHDSEAALLKASGYLCAVSLLTDSRGWTVDPTDPSPDYPSLRELEQADSGVRPDELEGALRTRLFAMTRAGRFEPMHRHVAEFLAGLLLGKLAEDRVVSPARLRAIMAGADGAPATSLRGLGAWIAVHSPTARAALVRDDPVGVAVYGDAREFSHEDQRRLASSLHERRGEIDVWQWSAYARSSLATPGALDVVRDMVAQPVQDDAMQWLVFLALSAFASSDDPPVPQSLRTSLLILARDRRWLPDARAAAMKCWIASPSTGDWDTETALAFLNDIRNGEVDDPTGALTGLLLGRLYPQRVAAHELWDHAPRTAPNTFDAFHSDFWKNEMPERSEAEGCLAEVLDGLCAGMASGSRRIDDSEIREGVAATLVRALERHGDDIAIERLYDWLALAMPWMPTKSDLDLSRRIGHRLGVGTAPDDPRSRVRAWLRDRPATQKKLILEIVRRQDDDEVIHPPDPAPSTGWLTVDDVLAGASVAGFAHWFLEQAVALSAARPWLACRMLGRTAVAMHGADQAPHGPSPDEVRARVAGKPRLEECLDSLLTPAPQLEGRRALALKRRQKRKEWIDWVRRHADALGRGEGPSRIWHEIARACLGINPSVSGYTTEERLRDLFLDDEDLTSVALDGLRQIRHRTDLPTFDEHLKLAKDGRVSYLTLPLLAALEEEHRRAADGLDLQGVALAGALGAFFFAPDYDGTPAWYRRALRSAPDEVADAFVRVCRAGARGLPSMDRHLYALAHDDSHGQVARAALPRLLESFPAKATVSRTSDLDLLLPAALEHVDREELLTIVHCKLKSSSLRIGQRVRWLATGLLLDDQLLAKRLDGFLAGGSDMRVRELGAFLEVRGLSKRVEPLSNRTLAMLVETLGRCFPPRSGGGAGYMPPDVDAAIPADGLIPRALDTLSRSPSPEATDLIRVLQGNEKLASWRAQIAEAADTQRIVRLDAEYEPPTISAVMSALNDAQPANAADLAALARERILAVGEQIRDGDADLWRAFWNEGRHGKPNAPKTEPSCQMALLNALRSHLPVGVRAEAEARYAGNARADLQISFGDLAVPVETKTSASRDLWTGVDPRSGGHGIYVVFWHGQEHAKHPAPTGRTPRAPDELQERLAQRLPADMRRRVSVIVLDVSPP